MSYKNNRNKFSCHFGEDDIIIDGFRLNPVHMLSKGEWEQDMEIDFYMDDTRNVYLLRIINSGKEDIALADCEDIRYIIVHTKVKNTADTLREVVKRLKTFPYDGEK